MSRLQRTPSARQSSQSSQSSHSRTPHPADPPPGALFSRETRPPAAEGFRGFWGIVCMCFPSLPPSRAPSHPPSSSAVRHPRFRTQAWYRQHVFTNVSLTPATSAALNLALGVPLLELDPLQCRPRDRTGMLCSRLPACPYAPAAALRAVRRLGHGEARGQGSIAQAVSAAAAVSASIAPAEAQEGFKPQPRQQRHSRPGSPFLASPTHSALPSSFGTSLDERQFDPVASQPCGFYPSSH